MKEIAVREIAVKENVCGTARSDAMTNAAVTMTMAATLFGS